MKFLCSKNDLMDSINIVQKAVMNKASIPILEGILIDVDDNVKLTGNSFEIAIETILNADIKEKGKIVINSKMFGEIIRRLPDSEVMIELKDNNMILIECDNSHFEIMGLDAEGFPELPEIEAKSIINISQNDLKDMIKQTIFAVGNDENRPILTGTLIECQNGDIRFVSIDGFRLALRKKMLKNDIIDYSVIVPGKNLSELLKIVQPIDEEVEISQSDNQILFKIGECKIVSKLLEGDFLNYKNLIPDDFETIITVNKSMMLNSIERASLITNDDKRYPIKFTINGNKLIITSKTEIGNAREELSIDMDGNDLEIGFNPRYFIDSLRVIDTEEIKIYFSSNIGPCIIRPIEGDDFSYLILPVRIRN